MPFSSSAQAFISESSIAHFCNSGSHTRLTTWQSESSESSGWQVTMRFTIPSDNNNSCKRMECSRQLNAGSIERVYFQRSIALRLLGLIVWLAWGMFSATKRASEIALSHVGFVEDTIVSSLKYSRILVIGQYLADKQNCRSLCLVHICLRLLILQPFHSSENCKGKLPLVYWKRSVPTVMLLQQWAGFPGDSCLISWFFLHLVFILLVISIYRFVPGLDRNTS